MGNMNYTVGKYARSRGAGAASIMSTERITSDVYGTTATASFVEDDNGDITLPVGVVFRAVMDEPAWIAFGDTVATVGNDFYMRADVEYEWEIKTAGKVSVIDVA